MKTLAVVQHTSAEYLGLMEDHLEGRGVRFRYHRPFTAKGALPSAEQAGDGLVLLGGGPWGSAGERDLPTLADEVALTRECLARDRPIVGIGLGAQILALAAGGAPKRTALALVVGTAMRVGAHALNGYLPETFPVAAYMRDWPEPPPGAEVLAADAAGRPWLWQVGTRAFGFAGHPGLKLAMAEDLVMEFEEAPPGVEEGLAALRAVQRPLEDALVPIMTGLVQVAGWMDRTP